MRYIGPFFRMNKLSQKEINGQLFHFSKEAVRTLVLESKCGLVDSLKNYAKTSSSIDINTIGNISPLLCMYRKSSPNYIHNKSLNGFDEDSFKRDIVPTTNALMTINILNLSTYYSKFRDVDEKLYSYSLIYNELAKEQLNFYSSNLRSTEGVFVQKKNISENNSRNFNLVDKSNKFKFSDQAFMMTAYNLYSVLFPEEEISIEYQDFASEILQVLIEYKEKIYELPFNEILQILLALNLFYQNSGNSNAESLIIDLTDYLITKFDEKDYYVDYLNDAALFALVLMYSYRNTLILSFKEKSKEIIEKLTSLYDEEKELYLKLSSRREIRYSAFDLTFYFLALNTYANLFNEVKDYRDILSSLYRKSFINSGIINSWPEAPTLDDPERYRNLSLLADDMLDEIFFRMPTMPSPSSLGIAPTFNRYVTYSKKRESFSSSISSFDSYRNMIIHTLIINLFEDSFMRELNILDDYNEDENDNDNYDNDNNFDPFYEENAEIPQYETKIYPYSDNEEDIIYKEISINENLDFYNSFDENLEDIIKEPNYEINNLIELEGNLDEFNPHLSNLDPAINFQENITLDPEINLEDNNSDWYINSEYNNLDLEVNLDEPNPYLSNLEPEVNFEENITLDSEINLEDSNSDWDINSEYNTLDLEVNLDEPNYYLSNLEPEVNFEERIALNSEINLEDNILDPRINSEDNPFNSDANSEFNPFNWDTDSEDDTLDSDIDLEDNTLDSEIISADEAFLEINPLEGISSNPQLDSDFEESL